MDRISSFPYYVEKAATAEVDESDDRTMRFVASDESVDSYGDVISAEGWQLSRFKKNPIFLWSHSYRDPIGTVPEIKVEGTRLLARVKFAAHGVSETADKLWALAKAKILRAVSVGFTVNSVDDFEYIRDQDEHITGIRYLKQELLELSLVSVPANPNALSIARSLHLPNEFIARALPLDASVIQRQNEYRRRLARTRLAGTRLGPRQAVHRT